jgi:flagellar motor switch/type III secretory pathway protein FliN
MAVRPYTLLGASVLARVQSALQAALAPWCAQWGLAGASVTAECARAWEVKGAQLPPAWQQLRQQAGASLYLGWGTELPAQLESLVFPPDRSYAEAPTGESTLARGAAEAALADLLQALADGCVGGAAAQEPGAPAAAAALLNPGSGAIVAHIRLGRSACVCLLDGAAVAALRGAQAHALPALAGVAHAHALRDVALRLPLAIGQAEVALGSLMTLAVGDVVRLDTLVAQPLKVSGPDGSVWFEAHLGTLNDALAIEVAGRANPAPLNHQEPT